MTAKTAVAVSSLALALVSAGCLSFYEVAVETPIRAKLDVGPFQRVLVAGFVAGGTKNIDPNADPTRVADLDLREIEPSGDLIHLYVTKRDRIRGQRDARYKR